MKFSEVVAQAVTWLQREGRVSYRALKREFDLDDEFLADVTTEIIEAKRLACDEEGRFLVWTGADAEGEKAKRGKGEDSPESRVQSLESEEKRRASTAPTLDPRRQTLDSAGERRQLTVEFIDLVGSTTLSQQLDPEDYHACVQAYQAACHQVIQRYDGHIAQYLGDGVLVYFGYPVAHEDDAVRAVRSGLEIVAAVGQLEVTPPLQVRIGIHTGPVVVSEIGAGERTERLALGETPNIAARVQGLAEPDTVVLSAATYQLVHGLFACQDLGPQTLKGIAMPMVMYRAVGESAARSRFEVAVQRGLTPLVGRADEFAVLQRGWEHVKAGAGQVILLNGEAGIGKSRLVHELKEQIEHEHLTRIEFRCSPYHQNSAFYPIIDHLQRLLQFAREDAPAAKLEKLQHLLSRYRFPQADTVPLLAAFLSLPHPAGCSTLTLSPQKQKQKTQEALVTWLLEEAERAPVYCLWEDLHWADPSTLEFLRLCLDQAPTARLLLLLTFRPDFRSPWSMRSYFTLLTLSRLGRQQVETMVEQVTGGNALPVEVVEQIVARTDGVPVFVEELTKNVMESTRRQVTGYRGQEGTVVGAQHAAPFPVLDIPATLQDALMARLDRLGPAKEVVQIGATLGREFSYELLQAVSPQEETHLQQALTKLVEAEVLFRRGVPPQTGYLFKHALIQDVAYQSLLKSKRQQLHQQVAQVLEARFSEVSNTQPELLAHHYTEAGLIEQALPYWQQAGQNALQRSANLEAIRHLRKGLELVQMLPVIPEWQRQELQLQMALGPALIATKGYAAVEVEHAYTRALELCPQLADDPQRFPVLDGLWAFYWVRAELKTSCDIGKQLLSLARAAQDTVLRIEAHWALGCSLFWLGELASAREQFAHSLALYEPQAHHSLTFLYGQDPEVSCLCYLAFILWQLGHPDQALAHGDQALVRAQQIAHPYDEAFVLGLTSMLHQLRREVGVTQARAERARSLSAEQGFPFWEAVGLLMHGWALQDTPEEGLTMASHGLRMYEGLGSEVGRTWLLALVSETASQAGHHTVSLDTLEQALTAVNKTGERCYEAELYRLRGELMLAQSSVQSLESGVQENQKSKGKNQKQLPVISSQLSVPNSQILDPKSQEEAEAEECFLKAIEVAQKQHAKSWELRATASLAHLWQRQGKQHQAHTMLSEIYHWFTEGFETKDLQEAKALLESLNS